jgi:hypothetical protein
MSEYTTLRLSTNDWKRINQEREPRENLGETLARILNERDRLRNLIKAQPQHG